MFRNGYHQERVKFFNVCMFAQCQWFYVPPLIIVFRKASNVFIYIGKRILICFFSRLVSDIFSLVQIMSSTFIRHHYHHHRRRRRLSTWMFGDLILFCYLKIEMWSLASEWGFQFNHKTESTALNKTINFSALCSSLTSTHSFQWIPWIMINVDTLLPTLCLSPPSNSHHSSSLLFLIRKLSESFIIVVILSLRFALIII